MGSAEAAAIANLQEITGASEDMCRAALRAAFHNPARAAEYILEGNIPASAFAHSSAPPVPSASPGSATPATAPATASPSAGGAPGRPAHPLDVVRSHPQWNSVRSAVQRNPALITNAIGILTRDIPGLTDLIRDNREVFLAMLNEPVDAGASAGASTSGPAGGMTSVAIGPRELQLAVEPHSIGFMIGTLTAEQLATVASHIGLPAETLRAIGAELSRVPQGAVAGGGGGGMGGGMGGGGADPPGTIRLTREEAEAVRRLMGLGFSQQAALQAYMAFDKNEQLAANFLFEQGGDGGFGGDDDDDAAM